jgi:hypothetical protein
VAASAVDDRHDSARLRRRPVSVPCDPDGSLILHHLPDQGDRKWCIIHSLLEIPQPWKRLWKRWTPTVEEVWPGTVVAAVVGGGVGERTGPGPEAGRLAGACDNRNTSVKGVMG